MPDTLATLSFTDAEWDAAVPWDAYLASIQKKREVWDAQDRRVDLTEVARSRLENLPGARRVLMLSEDWCGDAARSLPAIAKALAASPGVEFRVLGTDDHPDPLSRNLTHGGRAIPLVLVQDEHGRHLGLWGPRPAPLQALLRARKLELDAATSENMATWYAPIMGWYGKDKGRTTIDEVLMILERGGAAR